MIAPPPLIFLAGLAVGFALEALLPGSSVPDCPGVDPRRRAALGRARAAFLLQAAFTQKKTPANPWRPTTAIATDGPYRLTRNPAYLGMALVYVGIALCSQALWVLVPLPIVLAIIDRGVIAREEHYLERKFGQEYLDYKRRVRRWV